MIHVSFPALNNIKNKKTKASKLLTLLRVRRDRLTRVPFVDVKSPANFVPGAENRRSSVAQSALLVSRDHLVIRAEIYFKKNKSVDKRTFQY